MFKYIKPNPKKTVTKTVYLLVCQSYKALHHLFICYHYTFWVHSLKINTELSGFCSVFWQADSGSLPCYCSVVSFPFIGKQMRYSINNICSESGKMIKLWLSNFHNCKGMFAHTYPWQEHTDWVSVHRYRQWTTYRVIDIINLVLHACKGWFLA